MTSKGKLENILNLLRDYIRQETVQPIRSLFSSLLSHFLGSLLLAFGIILISIGVVGFLQQFDRIGGWFSWVPYLAASLSLLLMAFFAFKLLLSKKGQDV